MTIGRLLLGLVAASALCACANAIAAGRGADVPWETYEAENANTNGTVLGPDYTGHTPAREASGRRCVRLAETGQFVEFTAHSEAQGLVVRYCIPDSADGQGIGTTLSLYINSQFRGKLPMTSKYCYLYGPYPYTKNPADGTPRHFWDELRLMPGTIHDGDVIRLQKDRGDTSPDYLIDFIDLEQVPPPLQRPADSLSVADFGTKADARTDDRAAFQVAIAAARRQRKTLWVPPGRYLVGGPLYVHDVAMRGAGMWYSTLVGAENYTPDHRVAIYGDGSNVTLSDFAMVGNLKYRNDREPNDGLGESFGTGSVIRNIWVEHTKTGAWLVNSDGLLVEGCRFRDTIADGINLCAGMRDTTVRDCTARGTGDDCFAAWPAIYRPATYVPGHNRFVHCTAQLPFLAQGFSIYGGDGNSVEDCQAIDISYGAGIFASTTFPTEFGFRGMTTYRNILLTRTGDEDGAIGLVANLLGLSGLRFLDVDILDSPRDAVKFTSMHDHGVSDTTFDRVHVVNAGTSGQGGAIAGAPGAVGAVAMSHFTIVGGKTAGQKADDSAIRQSTGTGNATVERPADVSAARRASVAGQ
ncbi:MAG TPA: glycosyl hydrolase family 28-related protein [Tepidisphaeraceae bacterium]|nr:glycosyl hydrolase family 28-related protein [Tepidisphaeraceae bacterium]